MKKTNKDLLKWLKLKVGDVIRVSNDEGKCVLYKVTRSIYNHDVVCIKIFSATNDAIDFIYNYSDLATLIGFDYEKVDNFIGDRRCDEYEQCKSCPLYGLSCQFSQNSDVTLYEILDGLVKAGCFDKNSAVYKHYKDRLDALYEKEGEETNVD